MAAREPCRGAATRLSARIRDDRATGQDVNDQPQYEVPEGELSLSGPVVRPDGSGLPIRGDIAHIALASRYLVASYVVPLVHRLAQDATLRSAPREDAESVTELPAGTTFELLDAAGDWAWGSLGPDGPAGYLPLAALAE